MAMKYEIAKPSLRNIFPQIYSRWRTDSHVSTGGLSTSAKPQYQCRVPHPRSAEIVRSQVSLWFCDVRVGILTLTVGQIAPHLARVFTRGGWPAQARCWPDWGCYDLPTLSSRPETSRRRTWPFHIHNPERTITGRKRAQHGSFSNGLKI